MITDTFKSSFLDLIKDMWSLFYLLNMLTNIMLVRKWRIFQVMSIMIEASNNRSFGSPKSLQLLLKETLSCLWNCKKHSKKGGWVGCVSNTKTFCNIKDKMDNTETNTNCPLRIKRLCNEEQSDCPVTNKRFLKQFFQ